MNLFRILIEDDGFTLLCLIAILTVIGSKMTSECFSVRWWGWRAAAVTYVLFCCYAVCVLRPTSAAELVQITFRGLFAAGLTLGLFWILIPLLGVAQRAIQAVTHAAAARPKVSTHRQSEAEQRLCDETLRQQVERNARENHEAASKADAGRRRDEARLRCHMLYDCHGELLADQFPRERLQEYLDRYMSDSSLAEIVEQRAQTLTTMIDNWVAQSKSRQEKQFTSFAELAAFFQRQREEVKSLPYDTDVKDSLLCNINIQEEQAVRRFLS